MNIGAEYLGGDRGEFSLWGPLLDRVSLDCLTASGRSHSLEQDDRGYWRITLSDIPPGSRYQYRLNGETIRPDPASFSQPDGVHNASAVVDDGGFSWGDHDFGSCEHLATAWRDSFVYQWTYSQHRKRYHGSDARDRPLSQFVICNQNHDQIGNRMLGERLSQLVSFDALKLAAAATLLNPAIPLLFMGEEYGEDAPFLYFVDHQDADLVEAVRQGRKREFEAFHASGTPPDAASIETLKTSTLNWQTRF